MIGVHLGEGAVELALGADGHEHGDTYVDGTVADGVDLAAHAPLASGVVGIVDPGLVDVDDTFTTGQQVEHKLGVALAKE